MSQVKHRINQFNRRLQQQYGFLANINLSKYRNARQVISNMPDELYFNHPICKAIFTFTKAPLPPGTKSLLSLGLKFCIRHRKPTNNIEKSIERFQHDVRTRVWVAEQEDNDRDFNPKLYLKNPFWDPPWAGDQIEAALESFVLQIQDLHVKHQKPTTSKNLTYQQNHALNALVDHPVIYVCPADKNMGIALWNRHKSTSKILAEHLSNEQVYQNITGEIQAKKAELKFRWESFIATHSRFLPDDVVTFFDRAEATYGFDRIAPFRATCKVHKHPVKFRPVVAKCGTILEAISKWLDCELQLISKAYLTSWCIKDSDTFRGEVIQHELSPNSRLATLDATAMYSNIDIDHSLEIMERWIDLYTSEGKLPELTHKGTILAGLRLVMQWNLMKFGDSYFQQLIGTAMGTSCAVQFANLYFGWHEKEVILPTFKNALNRISFYKRFIDDVVLIWEGPCDADWHHMDHIYNSYGILKWEFPEDTSRSVDFLDLTLIIKGNRIVTKTYQKPQNPYLYLPPHSAHAPGTMKGVIFGLLRTYYRQNSKFSDFVLISRLFFKRLVSQGWDQAVLKGLFKTAFNKLNHQLENPPPPPADHDHEPHRVGRLFFHSKYHPNDMPRREIRRIYSETLEEILRETADVQQFTIAYSKPTTIGSRIAKAAMYEVEGREVSKYLTGEVPDP